VTDGVGPAVVDPVPIDDPAAGAGLNIARELDGNDELVVLVDQRGGQGELGQGEQQLAPPLDRGRLEHAYGLGRSVGLDTSSIEAVRVFTKQLRPGHPLPRGRPGISRSKVYELLADGELPSVRIGRTRRIALAALEEFIAEHTDREPTRSPA
jgi:excisionase family DNA binding protein